MITGVIAVREWKPSRKWRFDETFEDLGFINAHCEDNLDVAFQIASSIPKEQWINLAYAYEAGRWYGEIRGKNELRIGIKRLLEMDGYK